MTRIAARRSDAELLNEIDRGADMPVGAPIDGAALRQLGRAVDARDAADDAIRDAVARARTEGHSWATIGAVLGVSRQAALKRFG